MNIETFHTDLQDVFVDGCKRRIHIFSPAPGISTVKIESKIKRCVREDRARHSPQAKHPSLPVTSGPHASTAALWESHAVKIGPLIWAISFRKVFQSASASDVTCGTVGPPELSEKGQSAYEQAEQLSNSSSCLQRNMPASAEARSPKGSGNLRRTRRRVESPLLDVCKSQVSLPFYWEVQV